MLTPQEISYKLAFFRTTNNLSSNELAQRLGVSRQTLFNLFNGRPCSISTYKKVVELVGDEHEF